MPEPLMDNSSRQVLPGGAHWLTMQELSEVFHQDRWHLYTNPWPRIGTYKGEPIYLSHDVWNGNIFLTGSHDGFVPALARLFQDMTDPKLSLVFFDPTARLKHALAEKLKKTYTICEIALDDPVQSLKYNPLAHMRPDTSTPERFSSSSSWQQQQANLLAHILVKHTADIPPSKYSISEELIEILLQASILHLLTIKPDAPLGALATLLVERHRLLSQLQQSPVELARIHSSHLKQLGRGYLDVLLDALSPTIAFLKRADIQTLTQSNQLDFTDLLKQPLALFYTLPADSARTFAPLTAMLFAQMTFALSLAKGEQAEWDDDDDARSNGVRFALERAETLGVLPGLEHWMNNWPETNYNMAFAIAAQSHDSFVELYGAAGRQILDTVGTHIVLPGATLADCQTYSRYCGQVYEVDSKEDVEQETPPVQTRPLIAPEEIQALAEESALLYSLDTSPALITLNML